MWLLMISSLGDHCWELVSDMIVLFRTSASQYNNNVSHKPSSTIFLLNLFSLSFTGFYLIRDQWLVMCINNVWRKCFQMIIVWYAHKTTFSLTTKKIIYNRTKLKIQMTAGNEVYKWLTLVCWTTFYRIVDIFLGKPSQKNSIFPELFQKEGGGVYTKPNFLNIS